MDVDNAVVRSSPSEERPFFKPDAPASLLTPARREALDALEREFAQLIKSASALEA